MESFLLIYLFCLFVLGTIVLYKYNVFNSVASDFITTFKKEGVTVGDIFYILLVYMFFILSSPFIFNFYIFYRIKVNIVDKILRFKIFVP